MSTNPWLENNRRIKAEKLANVIEAHMPEIKAASYSVDDFLLPRCAEARRTVEQEAGTHPGSEECWQMVVQMVKDRMVRQAFQKAKENLSCPTS